MLQKAYQYLAGGSGLQGKVPFGKKKGSFCKKGKVLLKTGKVPFCQKERFFLDTGKVPSKSQMNEEPFLF